MQKVIEEIKAHIKILNHNSTTLAKDVGTLKTDVKSIHTEITEMKVQDAEMKGKIDSTEVNVSWLRQAFWWTITTMISGLIVSIALGILWMVLK